MSLPRSPVIEVGEVEDGLLRITHPIGPMSLEPEPEQLGTPLVDHEPPAPDGYAADAVEVAAHDRFLATVLVNQAVQAHRRMEAEVPLPDSLRAGREREQLERVMALRAEAQLLGAPDVVIAAEEREQVPLPTKVPEGMLGRGPDAAGHRGESLRGEHLAAFAHRPLPEGGAGAPDSHITEGHKMSIYDIRFTRKSRVGQVRPPFPLPAANHPS
jgi:hypothetical protein